jgi:3-oxoacyl-[acyl-carrier protein] reductase
LSNRLNGKTALVTGASRGIGRQIALKLAGEGALVAAHYGKTKDGALAVVKDIEAAGGRAFAIGADVGDITQIAAMFEGLGRELTARGANGLDILVNNAGVGAAGDVSSTTEQDFDRVFDTNVKGLLFVTQHAMPLLRDGGRIINLSSMVGHNAYPGAIAYAASKAAVDSMTLSLAAGLGPRGITVNAVAPGATKTDFIAFLMDNEPMIRALEAQTALGRLGVAEDIAGVVCFLASDEARWITGERIRASGGMQL